MQWTKLPFITALALEAALFIVEKTPQSRMGYAHPSAVPPPEVLAAMLPLLIEVQVDVKAPAVLCPVPIAIESPLMK
jgi:hypothetical protein